MTKKVFINPGHGGSDPGAVANDIREKDAVLVIALECDKILKSHGIETLMSRYTDEDDSLNGLCVDCNKFDPDLAVSIHLNAGGGDGAEVLYSIVGGIGKELAQNILDEIIALGQQSRGIKTRAGAGGADYYGFIRMTVAPAVIVEGAFLDTKDHEIVDTVAEQKVMGVAIAKGVLKTLGIEYKEVTEEKKEEAKPTTHNLTNVQLACEVWEGKHGNGEARRKSLGTKYTAVQSLVEHGVGKSKTSYVNNKALADEVWQGLWGNGSNREALLTNAGFDYDEVQKIVNNGR